MSVTQDSPSQSPVGESQSSYIMPIYTKESRNSQREFQLKLSTLSKACGLKSVNKHR